MNSFIHKKILRNLYSIRWILLFELSVFACFCGETLVEMKQVKVSVWQYMMIMSMEHYYLLYLWIPICIFIILKQIKQYDATEVIRYKNFYSLMRTEYVVFFVTIVVIILLHYCISFFTGVFSLSFQSIVLSHKEEIYEGTIKLLYLFQEQFSNSLLSMFIISSYFIAGILFVWTILFFIRIHFGFKQTLYTSVGLFFSLYFGFLLLGEKKLDIFSIFGLNNYIIFHHSYFVHSMVWFLMYSSINLIFQCYVLGVFQKKKSNTLKRLIPYRKYSIWIVGFLSLWLLFEWIGASYTGEVCISDLFVTMFVGNFIGEKSVLYWMKTLFLFLLPVTIIGIIQTKFMEVANTPIFIRYRNKKEVNKAMENVCISFVTKYILLLNSIIVLLYVGSQKRNLLMELESELQYKIEFQTIIEYMIFLSIAIYFTATLFLFIIKYYQPIVVFLVFFFAEYGMFLLDKKDFVFHAIGFGNYIQIRNEKEYFFLIWSIVQLIFCIVYHKRIRINK